MTTGKIAAITGLVLALFIGSLVAAGVGFHNDEVGLRKTFDRKIDANHADFDDMWKTIAQVAQVPSKYKDDFADTFQGYVKARQGGNTGEGAVLSFLTEAVPQYDAKELYVKVQTVIEAKRTAWTARQKELVDVKLQHDLLISQFPGSVWAGAMNREELVLALVTSSKTDRAFETGSDDEITIF